jgi:hypothetical protein
MAAISKRVIPWIVASRCNLRKRQLAITQPSLDFLNPRYLNK